MKVRVAEAADHAGILRLYMQFNEDRVSAGVGDAQYKTLEGEIPWKNTLADRECVTFVAIEREILLGFITVRLLRFNPFSDGGKLAEVDLIVVERKLRRRGVGTQLFDAASRYMQELGVTNFLLNVKIGNPATFFWEKMGFEKVSDTDYKRSDGVLEQTIYMVKKI